MHFEEEESEKRRKKKKATGRERLKSREGKSDFLTRIFSILSYQVKHTFVGWREAPRTEFHTHTFYI